MLDLEFDHQIRRYRRRHCLFLYSFFFVTKQANSYLHRSIRYYIYLILFNNSLIKTPAYADSSLVPQIEFISVGKHWIMFRKLVRLLSVTIIWVSACSADDPRWVTESLGYLSVCRNAYCSCFNCNNLWAWTWTWIFSFLCFELN